MQAPGGEEKRQGAARTPGPEVEGLFAEWMAEVEGRILDIVREKGSASAEDVASALCIPSKAAIAFLIKMGGEHRLDIIGVTVSIKQEQGG
jgi:hypothetical protein